MFSKSSTNPLLLEYITNLSPQNKKSTLLQLIGEKLTISPQLLILVNQDNTLKIDDVRWLTTASSGKKGQNEKKQIFVIFDLDLARNEAQNALLKILEEPPSGAYFVLTCSNLSKVLDTIKSRCQITSEYFWPEDQARLTRIAKIWQLDTLKEQKFHQLIALAASLLKEKAIELNTLNEQKNSTNIVKIGRKKIKIDSQLNEEKSEATEHDAAEELLFDLIYYLAYQIEHQTGKNKILYVTLCQVVTNNYRNLAVNVNPKLLLEEILFQFKDILLKEP